MQRLTYCSPSLVASFIGEHKYKSSNDTFIYLLKKYRSEIWYELQCHYMQNVEISKPNLDLLIEKFPDIVLDDTLSYTENYRNLMGIRKYAKYMSKQNIDTVHIEPAEEDFEIEYDIQLKAKEQIKNDVVFKEYTETDIVSTDHVESLEKISVQENIPLKVVQAVAQMERGNAKEGWIIDQIKKSHKMRKWNETDYSSQVPCKKFFSTSAGSDPFGYSNPRRKDGYCISGYMDCCIKDKLIFEAKKRASEYNFVNDPPDYDTIQLVVYMILSEYEKGYIVHGYNNEIRFAGKISLEEAKEIWIDIKAKLDLKFNYYNGLLENLDSKVLFDMIDEATEFSY